MTRTACSAIVSTKSHHANPTKPCGSDDLPPVGQPRVRRTGVALYAVIPVVLGEVEPSGAENRSRPVGFGIGPQFVAGGDYHQVGGTFDAVDGADAPRVSRSIGVVINEVFGSFSAGRKVLEMTGRLPKMP